MSETKALLSLVQAFFQDYLAGQRGLSPNTILPYRDALTRISHRVCLRRRGRGSMQEFPAESSETSVHRRNVYYVERLDRPAEASQHADRMNFCRAEQFSERSAELAKYLK